jgi:Uncharacterised nucleotidyltransferase
MKSVRETSLASGVTQPVPSPALPLGSAHLLLLEVLTLPAGPAQEAWKRWRAAANIDQLDRESFIMLPTLAGRLEPWLEGDPYGPILVGICRRAWSQNQVRLQDCEAARTVLQRAGILPVAAIGPLAWSARHWPDRAIRPVGSVDLLTEPSSVAAALQALLNAGYTNTDPSRRLPFDADSSPDYFARPVSLQSPSHAPIRLHWRAMPNTAFSLRRQPPIRFVASESSALDTLTVPPEEALVSAVGGMFDDGVDWRCDAAMIARYACIDWNRVAFHLRWRPQARRNLGILAASRYAEIAPLAFQEGWTRLLEPFATLLRLYRRARS